MSSVFILIKIFQVYFSGVFCKIFGWKNDARNLKSKCLFFYFFFSVTNLCLTSVFQMFENFCETEGFGRPLFSGLWG